MNKYDVVVIGGGPSGSIAARTLANSGAKVLLIERNLKWIKPCGGATPSISFEEFNLPRGEITRKINTISTISPNGFRVDVPLKDDYLAMIERGSFDSSLRRQAEEEGAILIEAELLNLRIQGSRGQEIYITIMEGGKERVITSDFLIAADGVNSKVARTIWLKPLPSIFTLQEDIDAEAVKEFHDICACEFWFGSSHAPNFYSWVFPKNGYIDIGTGATQGKALRDLLKNFKMRRGIEREGKQKIYRLPLKQRKSLTYGNILFVGDAGGLVMPLIYEGIYYAMRSGKMAAEAIIAGKPKSYEREWKRRFGRQFKFMEMLRNYFLKDDRAVEKLVKLHENQQMHDVSLKVWLEKDFRISVFLRYIGLFEKFFIQKFIRR